MGNRDCHVEYDFIACHLLGVPIGAAIFFEVSLFSCVAVLVSPLGELVVASHQISLSVTSLLFMVPLSLAISMTIRTGQSFGRQDLVGIQLTRKVGVVMPIPVFTLTMKPSAL